MYITGCRSTELLSPQLWFNENNVWTLKTLKTGEKRIFQECELSFHWRRSYLDEEQPYGGLTYDQLTAELRRSLQLHPIYAGDRIADTYLFRYNAARKYFMSTGNLDMLMKRFAWTNPATAHKYVSTPLIYEPNNRQIS